MPNAEPEEQWVDATSFAYGFGEGSPLGTQTIGEMIALNGWAYCKEPTNGTLMIGDRVVTTDATLIPHAEPAYQQDVFEFKEKCAFAGIVLLQDDVWAAVVGSDGLCYALILNGEVVHISKVTPKDAKDVLCLLPTPEMDTIALDIYPVKDA